MNAILTNTFDTRSVLADQPYSLSSLTVSDTVLGWSKNDFFSKKLILSLISSTNIGIGESNSGSWTSIFSSVRR
ncbi:hypothetical protein MnTg01_00910 [archaeon MnTg01]|nr:hypothetical protein MnTg01_00910 [archaeon MnTg01]